MLGQGRLVTGKPQRHMQLLLLRGRRPVDDHTISSRPEEETDT